MRTFLSITLLLLITAKASGQWQHIGPYSDNTPGNKFVSGRTDCIVTHPDYNNSTNKIMYAGSSRGGLWKTTDGGDNWTNIPTDFPMKYSTIMAIGIESGTNGSVYVSDHPFSGVYRLNTSLTNWSNTGAGLSPLIKEVKHIKVHPSNNQYIYVCSDQGIYRSINGGTTWSLVKSGKYENIDFMPRTGGSGIYPYYIYAAGYNTFDVSSDDGETFTSVTSVQPFFSAYDKVFADLDYTIGETTTEHYIYIFAAIKHGSGITLDYPYGDIYPTAYALYRYKFDAATNTESCSKLLIYTDATNSEDRLAITAYKGVAYFGGECFGKFDTYTNGFYEMYDNDDESLINSSSSTISSYHDFAHPDFHDALILPAYNTVLTCNDGGIHKNIYSPTLIPGINHNTCTPINNGLHISQVCGLAITDDDPDLFLTGEQDTRAFKSTAGGITSLAWGTEPYSVMIDRLNANRHFYAAVGSTPLIWNKEPDGSIYEAHRSGDYGYYIPYPSSLCNYFEYPGTSGGPFQSNTLFQHVQKPGLFYFGADGGLHEFCPSEHKFILKVRLGIVFGTDNFPGQQLKWCDGAAASFAMSENNPNRPYLTTFNNYTTGDPPSADRRASQVIRFTGPDFEDCWVGHNEDINHWERITPDFQTGVLGPVLSDDEVYGIRYLDVAVSHWNENKAWIICQYMPSAYSSFKVMMYNNGAWSNYSTGIPADEIMHSITAERGANDLLYAGTSRGVYYRDATMSQWLPMGTNLPHNEVRQLKINYGDNTLRAGTFGRGVWKSDLACPPGLSISRSGQYVTADDFVNAGDEIIASTVTIASGYTKYRAVNHIELLPGFYVNAQTSARFYAFIHGCSSGGNSFRGNTGSTINDSIDTPPVNEVIDTGFNIYPNPATTSITILSNTDITGTIHVTDLLGRTMEAEVKLNGKLTELDLSNYAPGIYLVRITTADKSETFRIIKK